MGAVVAFLIVEWSAFAVFLALVSGKVNLADWLFLSAFVVFVVHAALQGLGGVGQARISFVSIGLALVSLGLLVL